MSMRVLSDAAFPGGWLIYFAQEHLFLLLGVIAIVAAITVVLIVLLKKKNRGN